MLASGAELVQQGCLVWDFGFALCLACRVEI